jgi:uncharacterized protein YggE
MGLSIASCNSSKSMTDSSIQTRTINVTGSAEMEIEPDIIVFSMTIKEYWEEEFIKGKKYEDYQTKVPLASIEPQVLATLKKHGIKEDQIKVGAAGNYYRQAGKDFLVSKVLEVTVKDFETVDKVMKSVDSRGVSSLYIKELKHSKMDELEKKVKVQALKNAQSKAEYMLEALGEKCGKVLMINESEFGYHPPVMYRSNVAMEKSGGNAATELKNITISFKVNATFAIEE